MDLYFDDLFEDTKGVSRKMRNLLRKTLERLQNMLDNQVHESALEKTAEKNLSIRDKRKLLKQVYKQVLTRMGEEDNVEVFLSLIDNVPEDYLDYELSIDTGKAGELVKDLISGKGQISAFELGKIANIVKGVGVPAILNHATGEKKLDKNSSKFGSDAINKNVDEYLASKKDRMSDKMKLSAPQQTDIVSVANNTSLANIQKGLVPLLFGDLEMVKQGKLSKLVKGIKSSGMNIKDRLPDLASIIKNASDYKEANSIAKEYQMELEFRSQSEFEEFLSQVVKAKDYEREAIPRGKKKAKANTRTFGS